MTECLRCLRQHAAYACPDCGYTQPRATYRLGPAPVRVPLTPRVELLRAERLLARALLELGALESEHEPRPLFSPDGEEADAHMYWRWKLADSRALVDELRAKRDAAALSLDPEVVELQLSELPPSWRLQIPRDAGPAEVV